MASAKPHLDDPYVTRFFDIETGPLDKSTILSRVPEFDITEVKMGNTTDPDKIKEKLRRAKLTHEEKYVDRAALRAATGEVLAIGVMLPCLNGFQTITVARSDSVPEASMLKWIWSHYDGISPMVGFNIFGFDLPFLVQRSWMLGVNVPRGVRKGRNWCHSFVDLMELWACGDYGQKFTSLDTVSKCLGLEGKTGKGKDFAELFKKDREKALKYLENDLELTRLVAEKMGIPEEPDTGRSNSERQ